MKVGVLSLQGDVREHVSALIACGIDPVEVRRASELAEVDALVLPGENQRPLLNSLKSLESLNL